MRYSEIMIESRGMNAVKAALSNRIENDDDGDPDDEMTPIEQWGIMDDLWITAGGSLILYRELRLKQPWEKTLRPNGHVYWSTSNGGAAAYDANALDLKGTVDVKIVAELPANADVDWDELWETIVELHHQGEDELRLGNGIPLIVRHIYVEGQEVHSPWIGKTLVS